MTKLKRCPFCGGEAEMNRILNSDGEPEYYISVCKKHDCPGNVREVYKSEETAIKVWNTRTPEIVRCGECVYWEPENCRNPNILMRDQQMTYDDFCSWGERREEK
ncbi:Lar family restriction alleviation protein [Eubacterium callanderi]|uniref:Lar family restriction alleviation protein n=1 Tax=Eubacterium callanderi TaxID=53442 RepID=UPI0011DE1AC7|nr:Lar family restriction alleviation protein [Eubacterium callanderi]